MHPAFRSAAGIGTELCQLDSADLDVLPHVFQKYPETMRRRAYVYGYKRKGCPVLQRGQKCDQRFQNTQSTAVRIADRKSVSREGREKSRSPVLPAAVNLSNGPDSCSFCMNLLKIAGNMLVHHRKKYYT